MDNQVKDPSHYDIFPDGNAESIVEAVLSTEELRGWFKGNILKYRLRAGKKGDPIIDLDKAGVYEEWLKELE